MSAIRLIHLSFGMVRCLKAIVAGVPCAATWAQPCGPQWSDEFMGQGGMNARVHALGTYDDGAGTALFVGGTFTQAGSVQANRVARWNGLGWSPLGTGVRGTTGFPIGNGPVLALATYDSGAGEELIVGGDFRYAGEQYAGSIARWNGQSWIPMWVDPDPATCSDAPAIVNALNVMDLGTGARLYVGGYLDFVGWPKSYIRVENVASWDGQEWEAVTSGIYSSCFVGVRCIARLDMELGGDLCVGGSFRNNSLPAAFCVGVWNGSQWATLGGGIEIPRTPGFVDGIHAIVISDELEGRSVYIGGNPSRAGSVPVSGIARWDGARWHDVVGGLNQEGGIYTMTLFEDGSGPALYVGGRFTHAGGIPANNIAKWDGKAWSALGEGTNGAVRALAVWDRDGEGPEPPGLYVGGEFTMAGGIPSPYIAKWQGCATPTCYPDCDTKSGPGILDIFDFLCFGNRFAANDPYACDCDTTTGPGVCDIFDFLCFGNAFNKGCP